MSNESSMECIETKKLKLWKIGSSLISLLIFNSVLIDSSSCQSKPIQLKAIAHWVRNFLMCFFRICHPFLSKCMLRMLKRRNSNLIRIFYDGRKFRRQCVNVIDTTWGHIYFFNVRKFRTQCAMTFTFFCGTQKEMFWRMLPLLFFS